MSQYKSAVKKRYKEAVTDAHIIAYMTNPKFYYHWESDLEEAEIRSAEQWLSNINDDYEIELEKFKHRFDSDLYDAKMFNERLVLSNFN